jgi:hypothetical protein
VPIKPENRAEYQREYRAKRAAQRDFKRSELEAVRGIMAAPYVDTAMARIGELEKAVQMAKDLVMQADALARAERAKREELEAEVKHLKAELAKRGLAIAQHEEAWTALQREKHGLPALTHAGFNSRPFTPAPKGK